MLLTPAEVKKEYKISNTTLLNLVKSGILEVIKTTGGHRRYRKDDLDKLMKTSPKESLWHLQICFDNYQKMPQRLKIAGLTRFSGYDNSWSNEFCEIDEDSVSCLGLGIYSRVNHERTIAGGWVIDTHPRIRSMVVSCPPKRIWLKGNEDTGIKLSSGINGHSFCEFDLEKDEIVLNICNIFKSLKLGYNRCSNELPCFLTSLEVNKTSNALEIQPILYELEAEL